MVITTRPTKNVAFVKPAVDETVAESFPASAPASSLPNPDEHDAEGSRVKDQNDLSRSPYNL
jgi:hypothetical protein